MAEMYIAITSLILLSIVDGTIPPDNIHLTPSFHISLRAPPQSF
jgi:hypothetical protein